MKLFIKTIDKTILDQEVPDWVPNSTKTAVVQAHNEDGTFKADDTTTPDIDESKDTAVVQKTIREFTYCLEVGDIAFIEITGGYVDTCFSTKYPATEEIQEWFLSLGVACPVEEYNKALTEYNNESI